MHLSSVMAGENGWDIFQENKIESLSFTGSASLVSSLIDNKVSAISGEYVDAQEDLTLAGPETLRWQRFYSSNPAACNTGIYSYIYFPNNVVGGSHYCNWQFNHKNNMYLQLETNGHARHLEATAFAPHPTSSLMVHKGLIRAEDANNNRFNIPLLRQKGITNCSSGCLSSRTNPKNVMVNFDLEKKFCTVKYGNGGYKSYAASYYEQFFHRDDQIILYKLRPYYEIKPNGNLIIYKEKEIHAFNPTKTTSFSWMKYYQASETEWRLESSHFDPLIYTYERFAIDKREPNNAKKFYYLTSLKRPDQPNEEFQYKKNHNGSGWILKKKILPDRRFLEIDYYTKDDWADENKKIKIHSNSDPRVNRVKCLKAPVGTDEKPVVTHKIFYKIYHKIDPIKLKVTEEEFTTTVFDAYDRKSVYTYNAFNLLESLTQYINGSPYKETKYLWGKLSSDKVKGIEAFHGDEGNLLGKVILDGNKRIQTGRYFKYDKKGNVVSEKLYGNLTGTNSFSIILGEDQFPIDNGVQCYEKKFIYSSDEFHLLKEEKWGNGRSIKYQYMPKTDLVSKKLHFDRGILQGREFYEYDENTSLTLAIRDDGSGLNQDDLTDVKERHITKYHLRKEMPIGLPDTIDEFALDVSTGTMHLLKRTLQTFTKAGWLTKKEAYDKNKQHCYTLTWEYDNHGNVIKEMDAIGRTVLREYDLNDNLILEKHPEEQFKISYAYDFSNRLIEKKESHHDGEQFITHYAYDLAGNKVSQIDHFGNETKYRYDDLNRLIETIYPQINGLNGLHQPTRKADYDCMGNCVKETDERNFATEKKFNARGQVTSILLPDGQLEKFEYALDGSLIKKTASNGTTTFFDVDCFGRILKERVHDSKGVFLYETSQTYDCFHKTSSTDASGLTTLYDYDFAGRLVQAVCGDKVVRYEYDASGRLSKKFEPFEDNQIKVTCTEYDLLDRVIEERIEDEKGKILKKVAYAYDVWGNRTHLIEETAAGSSIHITKYNSYKKPIKIIDPEGHVSHISYNFAFRNDLNQRVLQTIVTDPLGRQLSTIHDSRSMPVRIEFRDAFGFLLKQQDIVYDEKGNVVLLLDHEILAGNQIRSIASSFDYQQTGQLICLTRAKGLPEQQITHISYNGFGQKETVTKPDGTVINFKYDALGRLSAYHSSDQSLSYLYTYNLHNLPVKVEDLIHHTQSEWTYDERGRLIMEKLANGISIEYAYDQLDRAIALKLPEKNCILYHYDALNLNKIERYQNQRLLYSHCYEDYDLTGQAHRSTSIHGQEIRHAYNLSKRPLSSEGPVLNECGARYDQVGRLSGYQLTDKIGALEIKFEYSDLDQLIREDGHRTHTYGCNSLHHRLSRDGKTSTFNGLHQLMNNGESAYDYDRAGNLSSKESKLSKTTYRYDADDRLIEVQSDKPARYYYDSFHRRLSKKEGGKTIRYLYAGQNEIGSMDESGQIIELRILGKGFGSEIGASVAIELGKNAYAPVHDFHGNIVSLVDESGNSIESYRYTAFGETAIFDDKGEEIAASWIGNPWQFSSKRVDKESGFVYFGRRYYDPENGRWVTADPAGLVDGTNLYAYLHHNPIGAWDHYGLFEESGQAQEQTNFPLQKVDHEQSDGTAKPQGLEEVNPNQFGPDLRLKRSGKTGQSYCCGFLQLENISFLSIHGICNAFEDAYTTAKQMSEDGGGVKVNFVYDKSRGFLLDLIRCMGELYFNVETDRIKNARQEICDLLNDTKYVYIQPHSEAGIVTRNVTRTLPKEMQQRLIIVGFAAAAYLDEEMALKVRYYCSSRDIVPYLDIAGFMRCRETIEVLKPHMHAPLFDHTIASPTYRPYQKEEIQDAMKTYGLHL